MFFQRGILHRGQPFIQCCVECVLRVVQNLKNRFRVRLIQQPCGEFLVCHAPPRCRRIQNVEQFLNPILKLFLQRRIFHPVQAPEHAFVGVAVRIIQNFKDRFRVCLVQQPCGEFLVCHQCPGIYLCKDAHDFLNSRLCGLLQFWIFHIVELFKELFVFCALRIFQNFQQCIEIGLVQQQFKEFFIRHCFRFAVHHQKLLQIAERLEIHAVVDHMA